MNSPYDNPSAMADSSHRSADDTLRSGQQAAHRVVDRVADSVGRSASALRDGSEQLRERARHAADSTIVHIRQDPMKSVLIAGAIGAVLGLLLARPGRSRY